MREGGFLGIPAGFLYSGLILGPAVLIVITVCQWMAAGMLVQVASRAHALLLVKSASATLTPVLKPLAKDALSSPSASDGTGKETRPPSLHIPSHTSYEVMLLTRLHLGRWAERVTMIALGLYLVGTLWSYIAVFSSSLAATVPLPFLQAGEPCDIYKTEVYGGGCISLYYWWVLSFGMLMSVLLALDLREQAAFQCAMTLVRGLIILLMVGTLALGTRADFGLDEQPQPSNTTAELIASLDADPTQRLVRWPGLQLMVPIGVFCQNFQIGVPSLLQPLGRKKDVSRIFGIALTATLIMYTALGYAAVHVLGADVDPSCNLNWQSYVSSPIALAVALFPAVDAFSVFPLNAAFLSNNLMACVFQRRWHAGEISRRTKYLFRVVCVLPSFVCAFAFPSLSKALDFTGIVGIILPFIITPLLHASSRAEGRERWGTAAFDRAEAAAGWGLGSLTSPWFVLAFGVFGSILLAFCVVCGLIYGF